jgi:hypothetical protein
MVYISNEINFVNVEWGRIITNHENKSTNSFQMFNTQSNSECICNLNML